MRKTVIAHFYNEEYLLPFWIQHHKQIFDHGILINHGSTDSSIEIIRNLAPEWEIVNSNLKVFDAVLTDFEVQKQEEGVDGWKICLNISEFLLGDVEGVLSTCERENIRAISTEGIIMVDQFPNQKPDPNRSLIEQKPFGILDSVVYDLLMRDRRLIKIVKYIAKIKSRGHGRSRLMHRHLIGAYTPGRHSWYQIDENVPGLYTAWFGFSPWTNEFIDRKLSFAATMPNNGTVLGSHHLFGRSKFEKIYQQHLLLLRIFGVNVNNIFR
jgi:hypothetical protein